MLLYKQCSLYKLLNSLSVPKCKKKKIHVFVKHYAPHENKVRNKPFLAQRSKSRVQGQWFLCHLKGYH